MSAPKTELARHGWREGDLAFAGGGLCVHVTFWSSKINVAGGVGVDMCRVF